MFAEIAVGGTRAGAVVSQIAVAIPQFDLVGFRAFNACVDLIVGNSQAPDGAYAEIFLTAPEGGSAGEVFESFAGNQLIEHRSGRSFSMPTVVTA